LDPAKFAAVVGWYGFVVWAVGALARDARRLRLPPGAWLTGLAAAGSFGLLPLVLVKYFPIGMFFACALFLPLVYAYCHVVRNPAVRPTERVLTDEHLVELGKSWLEGVGVRFDAGDGLGPQVRLQLPRDVRREPGATAQATALETLLTDALRGRASEFQVDAGRERVAFKQRIDGVWNPVDPPELNGGCVELLARLAAGKNGDGRRAVQLELAARIGGKRTALEFAAAMLGPKRRYTIRLPKSDAPRKVEELSLPERDRQALLDALRADAGLVLFVSPPSSGRWTALQACIGNMDLLTRRVAVVEEPNRPYRGPEPVERAEMDAGHAAGYAEALKTALAMRPHVLLCGRLAGAETVQLALDAARERLVIAGVDARGVVDGVVYLSSFGVPRPQLAEALRFALGQRLPRKLCVECREAYAPSLDAVRRANLGEMFGDRLYRARPGAEPTCEACGGVGYRGCLPLYETLPLSARMRGLIRSGVSERELLLEARKEGMESPSESALRLLASGATSADELRRALQTAQPAEGNA
jgi:type II secretory ATPase GspE/PulE/Tfp pilus assembly ATPase PilB-like protein